SAGPAVPLPAGVHTDQVGVAGDGTLWVVAGDGLHAFRDAPTSSPPSTYNAGAGGAARLVMAGDEPAVVGEAGVQPFTAGGEPSGPPYAGTVPAGALLAAGRGGVVGVDPAGA